MFDDYLRGFNASKFIVFIIYSAHYVSVSITIIIIDRFFVLRMSVPVMQVQPICLTAVSMLCTVYTVCIGWI